MENEQDINQANDLPITIPNGEEKGKNLSCRYEKLLQDTYRKDEIIVFFKNPPSPEDIEIRKRAFIDLGFDPETIQVLKCDNCDIPVVLFKAENIHTVINTDPVRAPAGGSGHTVGESLNFLNHLPFDKKKRQPFSGRKNYIDENKDKIVVAVLDTGFDTELVSSQYLWKGATKKDDYICYKDIATGWNFINDSDDFADDNDSRHGSIVSQFIINQFEHSPFNTVEIMPLKTHDKDGEGDLFKIICAIHFAIAKGANIINASWGFYYYYEAPVPYLQYLITEKLKEENILFITATGNKVDKEDAIARNIYYSTHRVSLTADQLRNLAIHYFYPAHLGSDENNVITVTTTDGKIVSQTQNYSIKYADLGVLADNINIDGVHMQFKVPFPGSCDFISGSSFATAIATGIIGAFCKKDIYADSIRKSNIFAILSGRAGHMPQLFFYEPALQRKFIKDGVYTKKLE